MRDLPGWVWHRVINPRLSDGDTIADSRTNSITNTIADTIAGAYDPGAYDPGSDEEWTAVLFGGQVVQQPQVDFDDLSKWPCRMH